MRLSFTSHSLLHSINTLCYHSFFLCFYSFIVLFLVTTDEGSSPKRIVIQALGYILYLTNFMYAKIKYALLTGHEISCTGLILKMSELIIS